MNDGRKFFDHLARNDIGTYESIKKLLSVKGMVTQLLDFPYSKENYKLIVIDLSKNKALDADPKAIQQISFTGNLD